MAKDARGRPIPVRTPDPVDHQPQLNPVQEQFIRTSMKAEEAMRQIEELSARVNALEQSGYDRLNADLLDFEQRFDAMMLAKMQDFERRYEMMLAAPPNMPPLEEATPLPAVQHRPHR
jgi:hypothetical protein